MPTMFRSLLALSGAFVLAAAGIYWGLSSDLLNRSLIVVASVWLLSRSRSLPHDDGRVARWLGFAVLAIGLTAMPPAWFLAAQVGPRAVLLWWLMLAWLATACGAVLVHHGWTGFRSVAFSLFFLIFVLPLPQRVESPLQTFLQEATTSASATALSRLGFAVQREGFVLRLPGGELGVLEACSGIRSASAMIAIAALLAHLRGMRIGRGSLLVGLSLPTIVIANVFRVTASGILQEKIGVSGVQGAPHELLGFAAFLLGLGVIAGLSRLTGKSSAPSESDLSLRPSAPCTPRAALGMIVASVLMSLLAASLGWRSVERLQQTAPLDEIATDIGDWHGQEIAVPDEVRGMLAFDCASHRVYRDGIGQELHAWVIFWSGPGSVRGYHHPDVCWPNRGWTVVDKRMEQIRLGPAVAIPATLRRYENNGRRQVLCYWTQEGGRIWTDADEEAAYLEGTPGHRWILERLSGKSGPRSGRLAVLIGADLWGAGSYAEKSLLEFSRQFAAEMYRLMPWANPTSEKH